MWRLMPDLSTPKSCAIAFCVHQMVSSLMTTCTLPSSSGRLYNRNCISLLIVPYICINNQSIQLSHKSFSHCMGAKYVNYPTLSITGLNFPQVGEFFQVSPFASGIAMRRSLLNTFIIASPYRFSTCISQMSRPRLQ